jgi:uncharacterized protein YerC
MHYERKRLNGDVGPVGEKHGPGSKGAAHSVEEAFARGGYAVTDSGCWEYSGTRNPVGYGRVPYLTKMLYAHRVSYELANGPITDDRYVCHRCDNPPCVNPAHLFLGTHRENMDDMLAKKRNPRGSRHYRAILDEAQAVEVIQRVAGGERYESIAKSYGVTKSTVSLIWRGDQWGHVARPEGTDPDGGYKPGAKLTDAAVIEILEAIRAGEAYARIGERYGVKPMTISCIAIGRTWKHIPRDGTERRHPYVARTQAA